MVRHNTAILDHDDNLNLFYTMSLPQQASDTITKQWFKSQMEIIPFLRIIVFSVCLFSPFFFSISVCLLLPISTLSRSS